MKIENTKSSLDSPVILGALIGGLCVLNLFFLYMSGESIKTLKKERAQVQTMEEQKRIIDESSKLIAQYADQIDVIARAFPDDDTILAFIQYTESVLKVTSDEYKIDISPQSTPEGDRNFLKISIFMKSDITRLSNFMKAFEKEPYMTHIGIIAAQSPDGFLAKSDFTIQLKLYVQNTFTTR